MTHTHDCVVVGGGIVGLATALALKHRYPGARLLVVEKEPRVAAHQTGHNSGVIHAGVYYKPGSLKAKLCVEGARRMMEFCDAHGIAYRRVGKVIVATSEGELPRLDALLERARANGVSGARRVGADELRDIEPHAAGLAAIHSPNTGIVDYATVAQTMAALIAEAGVEVRTHSRVVNIEAREDVVVTLQNDTVRVGALVNCAGLHSDTVARMMGLNPGLRIVPFRGEYYVLKPAARDLVRGLIYPVPDPNFPFLGVHFTRMIGGGVEAGPNAVFAFAREGYRLRDVSARDTLGALSHAGFVKIARKWWRTGAYEFRRSFSKSEFVRSLQKLVPDIRAEHIERGGAGVRAQAIGDDGELVDDFRFAETDRSLHVLNAPSPAATASLAIGEQIADRAERILAIRI